MRLLPPDERGLRRALELARQAAAFASPNPTVGCVLMRGDALLGEGAHRYENYDHAEIVALKQARAAGRDLHLATACVTLEPCAHHGRTGPCADALIAAGISRCIVATIDPNPLVRGQGLARMSAAGIEVLLLPSADPLAQEARRLNDAFAFSIQHGRPFVTLKAAISADGKLAPPAAARSAKQPHWLTGEAARADVQQLRHASDAILTGIGTVLADDPSLTDRTGRARRCPLLRVVVDSQLRTPLDAKLLSAVNHDLLFAASPSASSEAESRLLSLGAEVVRLPVEDKGDSLDLHALLQTLYTRRIRSLLVEGGFALNTSFLHAALVDKLILYRADRTLGDEALPFAAGFVSPDMLDQRLTSIERAAFPAGHGEDIRTTGYLHDPWTGL